MSHPIRYVSASSDGAMLITIPLARAGGRTTDTNKSQGQGITTPRPRGEYRPAKGSRAAQGVGKEDVIEEAVPPRRAPTVYKAVKGSQAALAWEEEEEGCTDQPRGRRRNTTTTI